MLCPHHPHTAGVPLKLNDTLRLVLVASLAYFLAACATASPPRDALNPPPHPLLGLKIWAPDLQVMTPYQVDGMLADAKILLLGEEHDNPTHHHLQARIIAEQAGPQTHVVFEMIDDPVMASELNAGKDISKRWDASGWPAYSLYAPIFEALYETGAQAQAGNPPREAVKAVVKGGLDAIESSAREALRLGQVLSEGELEAMETEMVAAHCGHAHPMIGGMVDAQRFKDATMAKVLSQAPQRAILIAGRGHTRKDRGVGRFLTPRGVLSVAFIGVVPEWTEAKDYLERAPGADILWFTEGVQREDPCEAFMKHMKRAPKGDEGTPATHRSE